MEAKTAKDMRARAWKSGFLVWCVFLAAVALLTANGWYLRDGFARVRDQQGRVDHTHEVISALDSIMSALIDAETGQRGFQISGSDDYLQPFYSAQERIPHTISRLRVLTADNPSQIEPLNRLEATSANVLSWLRQMILVRRELGIEQARELFRKGDGKNLMDQSRSAARVSRELEEQLLIVRKSAAEAGAAAADMAFLVSSGANLLLAVLAFVWFRRNLHRQTEERLQAARDEWHRNGKIALSESTRGDFDLSVVCRAALVSVARHLNANVGNLFVRQQSGNFELAASFAAENLAAGPAKRVVEESEGVLGEAATQRRLIHLTNVPSGYLRIASSTGGFDVRELVAVPLEHQGALQGILELGSFNALDSMHLRFLEDAREMLGANIEAARSRGRLRELLSETTDQASELQQQQEELRVSNEELEARAEVVDQSRQRLQMQQEELRQTNEELEQQTRTLEAQAALLRQRNADLDMARVATDEKARALEEAGRYKSEFLANMSHELRTPLNSLLLLATLLAENRNRNLDSREVEFANTIHRAGNDLLVLINDVLDLAKVESGKLELAQDQVGTRDLLGVLEGLFRPLAEAKNVGFLTEIDGNAPLVFVTDRQRLEQILRNLLSNAVKFTQVGHVTLKAVQPSSATVGAVEFHVVDTGIGIEKDAQNTVFEAFRQADGSTSRQYGGTGLGLTISRELAHLLGGEIRLASAPGKGSTFMLTLPRTPILEQKAETDNLNKFPASVELNTETSLPQKRPENPMNATPSSSGAVSSSGTVAGRAALSNGLKQLLVVEDDPDFAASVAILANEAGFSTLTVHSGREALEELARGNIEAVVLDVKLPDMSGLSILQSIKEDPRIRHLPVHMISGVDRARDALKLGALGYLTKPVSPDVLRGVFGKIEGIIRRQVRRILVVEDDPVQRDAISSLITGSDVETVTVGLAREAFIRLEAGDIDCMILDLRLPDLTGFELLERLEASRIQRLPPVVVYTGQDLTRAETERLQRYAETIVLKGVRSPERLLDEVGLFLHRIEDPSSRSKRVTMQSLNEQESAFSGRRILVVDDDMRNVYALVHALEARGMQTTVARNGQEALLKIAEIPAPELLLMDIMMPGMDGLEATRQIRAMPAFRKLPIIALTAKAMRGDQENCIEAGANDYLAKPVDLERLLSLLRVWLPKGDSF